MITAAMMIHNFIRMNRNDEFEDEYDEWTNGADEEHHAPVNPTPEDDNQVL